MSFGRAVWAAALGTALVAVGLAFDTPSLLVPGIALGLLVVVSGVWVGAASALAGVTRAEVPARLTEDQVFELGLSLSAPLPLPTARLVDPLLAAPAGLSLARSRTIREPVIFARRGRRAIEPATLEISDPLRLWVRSKASAAGGSLLVVPRTEEVALPPLFGSGRAGVGGRRATQAVADGGRDASAVEFEIDGLRSYRHGTPASRIHWPSVARGGEMVERRLIAGSHALPLLVLDAISPSSEEALDEAVRAAASLAFALARRRGCAVLLPGERRATELDRRLGRWAEVLERFALVRSGTPIYGTRMAGRGRAVVWVSAGPRAAAERSLAKTGAERGLAVTPQRPKGEALPIAGCWASVLAGREATVAVAS